MVGVAGTGGRGDGGGGDSSGGLKRRRQRLQTAAVAWSGGDGG